MTREIDRCRWALEAAAERQVGGPGVQRRRGRVRHGGPVCCSCRWRVPGVEIEVVAGVTAALSGAAVLGAPLGHDFA
jgi:precorrin-3B C17-methyltransferase